MKLKKALAFALVCGMAMSIALTGCGGSAGSAPADSSAASSAAASTEASSQEEVKVETRVLRMGSTAPATSSKAGSTRAHLAFEEALKEISGGRLEIEYISGGVLGNTAQHYSQLSQGTLDMFLSGLDTVTVLTGCEDFAVVGMPYIFDDTDHLKKFIDSDIFAGMKENLLNNNHIVFGGVLCYQLPRILTTSNTPVTTPADLANLKIRVPESRVQQAIWSAWGANPISLPASELYTALDTGVADGQDNDLMSSTMLSMHEVQKYYMELDYIQQLLAVYISEQTWNSLSDEEKGWLTEALAQAEEIGTAGFRDDYDAAKAIAVEKGVEFVEVDKQAFMDVAAEVAQQFDGEMFSAGLYEEIRNLK